MPAIPGAIGTGISASNASKTCAKVRNKVECGCNGYNRRQTMSMVYMDEAKPAWKHCEHVGCVWRVPRNIRRRMMARIRKKLNGLLLLRRPSSARPENRRDTVHTVRLPIRGKDTKRYTRVYCSACWHNDIFGTELRYTCVRLVQYAENSTQSMYSVYTACAAWCV